MFYVRDERELAIKNESKKSGFFNDKYESTIQGKWWILMYFVESTKVHADCFRSREFEASAECLSMMLIYLDR